MRYSGDISGFYKTYPTQCTQKRVSGTTSNGAQCRKGVKIRIQNVPSLAHLCSAGQDLTLTDCLVSSLRLIGANFNDLMKQRTINISNISIATTSCCTTRAFSWLKVGTTAFTFKTLLRHYAKWAFTPRFLNVKLGLRRKSHKGRAVWLAARPL